MRRHQVLERSLASATAIGLLVVLFFILALPAQAHTWSVTHDCAGLNVVLRDYNTTGDNSLSITIDGQQVDIADFGRDHNESINWDPTQPHTYNVTVMAHDDLDGSIGWSFSVNDSQERCVNPTTTTAPATTTTAPATTTTAPTAVTTTTATASTIPDEVLPTSIPTSTEPEGSPTDVLPFTGSDGGPGALWAVILISGGLIILALPRRRHLRPRRRHLRPHRPR